MKKNSVITAVVVIAAMIVASGVFLNSHYHFLSGGIGAAGKKEVYYCPMHPSFTSDRPGDCVICGMSLVRRQEADKPAGRIQERSQRRVLYYRNPMDPTVTSPVPMKDRMGMDYVAVYEEEKPAAAGSVYISPQKQQLIGVKKQKVEKRKLTGQILTTGIVAYDPDLFVAQEEYLQALKTSKNMQSKNVIYDANQFDSIIKASRRKLLLFGMNDAEIQLLEKNGTAQQELYLPENGTVWIYITIYEYEIDLIRTGLPVQIRTVAYPERIFDGRIVSIAPVLDRNVRTLRLRAQVPNPDNKLKPEMYVDAMILIDFGEKLAVPEDAVMDTGTKKIVFVVDTNDHFYSRIVKLGSKAQGYYEVLGGLEPNDMVVASGNFLVDSESKLNTVSNRMTEPNH